MTDGNAGPVTDARMEKRAAMRREEDRGLAAAHPVRHHHRLAVHVVETVLLHLREDPVDGALETLRADGAIAERVDEGTARVDGALTWRACALRAAGDSPRPRWGSAITASGAALLGDTR